jgi:methyltransferase
MTPVMIVLIAAFAPMLIEAARSRRNERLLRGAGAVEPADDVYGLMQFVYPSCFIAMIVEGWMRGGGLNGTFAVGAAVFLAGKALKYWAMASLGERWTFRVLVLPEAALITTGPYRYLRHPNYVGVAGELVGAAFMAYAPVTGVLAVFGFGALMLARIRIEERALDVCAR